jgi:hypothetical protein
MARAETYCAAPSAYVVFAVICGIPALLGVAAALMSPISWAPVLIPVVAFSLACLWLSRFRLAFLDDRLLYGSLFTGEGVMPYENISAISGASTTTPFESPLTVSVQSKTGEELRINIKVFPREARQRLMDLKP